MTTEFMPIYLSTQEADKCWGDKALLSHNAQAITIHLNSSNPLSTIQKAGRRLDTQGIKKLKLAGEGWDLERSWHFWQGFRNPKGKQQIEWAELGDSDQHQLNNRLRVIDWVRDTINLPAQELGPQALVERVVDLLNQTGEQHITYQILKGEDLLKQGYQGLYSVGRGSQRPPVFLTLDYNPSSDPDAPVAACLVGKGITFDSGGYSLKPSGFMDSMKSDMGGAATIAGALALAIAGGLTQRIKLYLCCADNMVSGQAFKLGDIIHYRNGKSVEVMNTDAEGRLVLADGLIDADQQQAPLLIDCATLTGAAKTAVGNDYHSALSFDDQLITDLMASAQRQQELFWRLPLAEFHRNQLPSSFADLNNIAGPAHSAGASTAAAFLSHFVENYQQGWLHIDCSATYRKSAVEQWAAGATGLGVRTLADLLLTRCR